MPEIDYYSDVKPMQIDFRALGRELAILGDVAARARAVLKSELRQRAFVQPIMLEGAAFELASSYTADRERLLDLGQRATELVAQDMSLSPDEQAGLEAVIALIGRPAIFVRNNDYLNPAAPWEILGAASKRRDITARLPKVGRISAWLDGQVSMIGTGFVVGAGLILTNRHVAEYFAVAEPRDNDTDPLVYQLIHSADPFIDFKGEDVKEADGKVPRAIFSITGVTRAHPRHDLALLRVATKSRDPEGLSLPLPMKLASELPKPEDESSLYVVGYPGADNENVVPMDDMRRIFDDVYEVKRLQPGRWTAEFPAKQLFAYDCTTLGGNSGSCVVDLETNTLLGLHAKGSFRMANYAISLPLLKADPVWGGEVEFAE